MTQPVRQGLPTPSSNMTLEPVTCAMLAVLPKVGAHISRFRAAEVCTPCKGMAPGCGAH
jgi:maleate isomerase